MTENVAEFPQALARENPPTPLLPLSHLLGLTPEQMEEVHDYKHPDGTVERVTIDQYESMCTENARIMLGMFREQRVGSPEQERFKQIILGKFFSKASQDATA